MWRWNDYAPGILVRIVKMFNLILFWVAGRRQRIWKQWTALWGELQNLRILWLIWMAKRTWGLFLWNGGCEIVLTVGVKFPPFFFIFCLSLFLETISGLQNGMRNKAARLVVSLESIHSVNSFLFFFPPIFFHLRKFLGWWRVMEGSRWWRSRGVHKGEEYKGIKWEKH